MTSITVSEDALRRILAEFKLELLQELQQYARLSEVAALEARVTIFERDGSVGTKESLKDHEVRIRILERGAWQVRGVFVMLVFVMPILATISWHLWG